MYREHAVPPDLHHAIECFWTIEGVFAAPRCNRVVPDGCADIILDLDSGRAAPRPVGMVVGTMTRPLLAEMTGRVSLLGVRFRAGAITPLIDVHASALTDAVLPLEDSWRDAMSVQAALADAPPADRAPRFAARTWRLRYALRLLRDTDMPAVHVAVRAGYFDQPHLIRDVRELAGTTPERYRREQRVASIQSAEREPH